MNSRRFNASVSRASNRKISLRETYCTAGFQPRPIATKSARSSETSRSAKSSHESPLLDHLIGGLWARPARIEVPTALLRSETIDPTTNRSFVEPFAIHLLGLDLFGGRIHELVILPERWLLTR